MVKFNSYIYDLKRHLTLSEAETFKSQWNYKGEDEERTSKIMYRKKTNDYTGGCSRYYNS